ncbi:MAG: hypothetical protein ABIK36_06415 [Pseudomonadota bacterium]
MQAAQIADRHTRDQARDAIDAERNAIVRYGAGDASKEEVQAAEESAKAAREAAARSRLELARKREAFAGKYLEGLAPTAAEIAEITLSLSNAIDALRIKAASIYEHGAINGLPVPRAIAHAARLDRAVRQLRNLDLH